MDLNSINKTANLVHNNQMSLMVFQMKAEFAGIAPTFYGINVFKVREVIEGQRFPVAQLPNSHDLIEGMIQLRGTFIPVIDMPTWLGAPMNEKDREHSVIIVCDFSHHMVGFRVAHIHGVEEKEWSDLQPAKNVNKADGNRVVNQTTIKHDGKDELCFIIDVESLLAQCMPDMAAKLSPKVDEQSISDWKAKYNGKTLLLADDAKSIRSYLEILLGQMGINHKIFEDGQQLINHLSTIEDADKLAGIITDLEMPEASGHTVIKFVRDNPKLKHLQIAVHSSMTSENNARDAKTLGADYFIGKIDTDEITKTLEKMSQSI